MKCMKNMLHIELHKIINKNYKFLADRRPKFVVATCNEFVSVTALCFSHICTC